MCPRKAVSVVGLQLEGAVGVSHRLDLLLDLHAWLRCGGFSVFTCKSSVMKPTVS